VNTTDVAQNIKQSGYLVINFR